MFPDRPGLERLGEIIAADGAIHNPRNATALQHGVDCRTKLTFSRAVGYHSISIDTDGFLAGASDTDIRSPLFILSWSESGQ